MKIHTFGDSHASNTHSGWKDCNNIQAHHIGPILCHSFGKEKLNRCDINKFGLNNDDSVIFCFGEIDCRCHIYKHITDVKSYEMIIDDLIYNYIDAIKKNLYNCKIKLKHICIYNVVPPVNKYNTQENKDYPYLGSDEERKQYVLYFNKCLKKKCQENNWIFFDVYDYYIDNNGFLNKEFSDGHVHIKNGRFLKKFIDNYLL
jgi:hypothetical protein